MISTVLLFLVILSVLVLAHEWGHYFTAKKIGAKVEEFGLGFPPRLYSWKGKDGMVWSLNLIPLGGFVKIVGESGDHREEKDSFSGKSIPKRILVLAAGVIMNLVLAIGLFSVGFTVGIPSAIEGGVDSQAIVSENAIRVTEVLAGSPADEAGLKMGDEVLLINGLAYASGEEVRQALHNFSENDVINFEINRSGEEQTISAVASYIEAIDSMGVGAAIVETATIRYPWYFAPIKGIETTVVYAIAILAAFWHIIAGIFTGGGIPAGVSGPAGIAVVTGEIASLGFVYILQFAAMLSLNLAILNIIPFPALDGGRIAFTLVEAIRRKPASEKLEAVVHNLGFMLLMLLVIIVTYRDILNLI